ncbi:hypothetical protein [Shewanella aestuarii]|uniref:Thioredoxin fold domain-containing protein n=1 Tax=Shewanella aestuarii TaxID=1028752 RepID=A0A6G9QQB2_9GAMM|nr:hypothetical protein [Shewanella aestuarii]QIR16608.1 hypothetical protein HBH39_19220 [Shewanella aestuarii]
MWKETTVLPKTFSKNSAFIGLMGGLALSYLLVGSGTVVSCDSQETFSKKLFERFPSLIGEAYAFETPVCNVFAVKHGDSYAFFDNDLKVSIQGDMAVLQESGKKPVTIFGASKNSPASDVLTSYSESTYRLDANHGKYEIGYDDSVIASNPTSVKTPSTPSSKDVTEQVPGLPKSPSSHVGITNKAVNADLKNLDFSILPVYKAQNSRGALLTFVDTSCPACRRYTDNIADLNANGIDVYLAPFPRSGSDSSVGRKMLSYWCANYINNQSNTELIIKSFKGASLPAHSCDDELYQQKFNLFVDFGIRHLNKTTPVSFTNNGITIIANHPTDTFLSAFKFGDQMSAFVSSKSESQK